MGLTLSRLNHATGPNLYNTCCETITSVGRHLLSRITPIEANRKAGFLRQYTSRPSYLEHKSQIHDFLREIKTHFQHTLVSPAEACLHINADLREKPLATPLSTIQALSEIGMMNIENRYLLDGCDVRSRQIIRNLEGHVDSNALFQVEVRSNRNLKPKDSQLFQNVQWGYHIATALLAENNKIYILDPIESNRPIELTSWVLRFTPRENNTSLFIHLIRNKLAPGIKHPVAIQRVFEKDQQFLLNNDKRMQSIDTLHPKWIQQEKALGRFPMPATDQKLYTSVAYGVSPFDENNKCYFSFAHGTLQKSSHLRINALNFSIRLEAKGIDIPIFYKDKAYLKALSPRAVQEVFMEKGFVRIEAQGALVSFADQTSFIILE